jgi:hypothetical protein
MSFAGSGGGTSSPLTASPSSLAFGAATVGSTSTAQTVTVANPGSSAAAATSVSVSGPFSQTNNCGTSIAAGASCAVNVTFTPTASGTRSGTLSIASNAPNSPISIALSGSGASTSTGEGPYGGTAAAVPGTVQAANYDTGGQGVAYNVSSINGSANSYRSDGVDLEACSDTGGGYDIGWATGGQWFKYTVNVASAGTYAVSLRLASLNGVTDGLHLANSSGTNLSGSVNVPSTGGWQAWTTVTTSVTLPAGVQTLTVYQDNPGWNIHNLAFASSNTNTNLALNQPASASGYTQTYTPGNAVDGNTGTYWESTDNALPQWLQVDLGASKSISKIVLDLPSTWGARTQTLSVLGSTDGSTFTTLVASAGYTFDPTTGDTVTISFPSTSTRYVRLNITGNTAWPAGQISEFQIFQ